MLRLAGIGGSSMLLTACGGFGRSTPANNNSSGAATAPNATTTTSTSSGATTTTAATSGTPAASGSSAVNWNIVDTGAQLPSSQVTLRWMDSGDVKANFFKAFFPAYTTRHPNIQVQYDGTNWNEITQVVTLGFRNGTAPDVFQLPPTITAAQAEANGWIGALDDIVPNWADVKGRFPAGMFAAGVTDFGGKTYGYPFTSNKRINNLLLYNQDHLQQAGYDPSSKPLTWDEFRAACKKCTDQGAGKYYGLIIGIAQSGQLTGFIDTLAEMAGAHGGVIPVGSNGGEFNHLTGQFNFTSDEFVSAVELLLAIKSDGSIFPGSVSLDAPGARGRMPQGLAAMILQGPWNIPIWTTASADFHLGVSLAPQKDPNHIWPLTYGPGGSNTWYYASSTQLGSVVGDMFAYLGTVDGQTAWAHFDPAGDPAAFPEALAKAQLDPLSAKAAKLAADYTRLRPDPSVKNPDVFKVFEAFQQPTPNYNDTLVGLFTGDLQDVKQTMTSLQDRMNAALDDAIKTAQSRGAKVSRDDFVFSDWDPSQDYTSLYRK
ncbi:MAG: extracellular solute-binding protein [Chloroflexi bacterium]|nr:extracellular solute-binding protein [Chloroflexota bacterium]